jgi:predicted PurR-regulated permease PerM
MKSSEIKIEISQKTIISTLGLLFLAYLLYQIIEIIILLIIVILFATAINPFVTRLETWKIPRPVSIAIVYVIVIGSLVMVLANLIPQLITQGVNLIKQINLPPSLTQELMLDNINLQNLQIIANQLNSVPRVLNLLFSAFSSVIAIFSFLVMTFYLLMERPHLHRYLTWLFKDNKAEHKAEKFISKLETQIGNWVRGEFTLMLIVGVMTYIGLTLLGIDYALPLALLAGLLEILPNLGPTISAIPAIIVAYLSVNPVMALAVLALYILVQQLENNFIVPYVMRHAVGLSPVITILLMLIGFRLGGVVGAILAIPVFLILKVVAVEFYKLRDIPPEDQTESKKMPGGE